MAIITTTETATDALREVQNPILNARMGNPGNAMTDEEIELRNLMESSNDDPLAIYSFNINGDRGRIITGYEVDTKTKDFRREVLADGKSHLFPFQYELPYYAYIPEEIEKFELFLAMNRKGEPGRNILKVTGRNMQDTMARWDAKKEELGATVKLGIAGKHTENREKMPSALSLGGINPATGVREAGANVRIGAASPQLAAEIAAQR